MASDSNIARHIRSVVGRGEKALGIFLTSGFPDRASSLPLLQAIDAGGADFIELGMPFSDPLAEGLPIQYSSQVALSGGITMQDTLQIAKDFRASSETPLILMGYGNPILRYGVSNFFEDARSSGVNGVILPDVPPEEGSFFVQAAKSSGVDFISLIAPTTPSDRVTKIDEISSGFVYAVSITGITGADLGSKKPILDYLKHSKSLVKNNPLMVGFGIRTQADVVKMTQDADGAIVGSALVSLVRRLWEDNSLSLAERLLEIQTFIHDLKTGTLNEPFENID